MHIIIVGEDKLSYFLTKSFISKGYRVTQIVYDEAKADKLARNTKADIINGNATNPEILRSADAYYCDLLIAVTPRDEDNLVIAQLAEMEFGISKTIALANDPDNVTIFKSIGIKAFSPTRLISQMIEQSVQLDDILTLFQTDEGKVIITEFKLNEFSPILGIPLKEINKPQNTLLISITRKDQVIIPNGDSVLEEEDKILVLSTPENHSELVRMITGSRL